MTPLRTAELVFLLLAIVFGMRRMGGRLAPRAVFGTLLFLLTRRAVLAGWVVGAAGMFWLMYTGARAHHHDIEAHLPLAIGVSLLSGLGFAALVVGPAFMLVRALARAPVVVLEPGERLLGTVLANHFRGAEGRGGKLLLTSRRLAFRPHRFNVQLETWTTPLEAIRSFAFEGDRFLLVDVGAHAPEWIVVHRTREVAATLSRLAAMPEPERTSSAAAFPGFVAAPSPDLR
jgi:hypothetical protein